MPDGYQLGARSGYAGGGNGEASPVCVRPPSAIFPAVRATRYRSGLCVERCHGYATRPDGHAKHRPCRHAVWQDVCVAGPQALLLKGRLQAVESACGNHVPEPPICSPPEAVRVDRRADGACNRACCGPWDWGRYVVRRGGDGMLAESTLARSHGIWSYSRKCCSMASWMRCQVPACCQACRRRQQLMPLPQPSSRGRYSQGKPALRTNRMPVKAARSSMRGRPPLGEGRCAGSKG